MKLTNPTDEELNRAFAENVAGYHTIQPNPMRGHGGYPHWVGFAKGDMSALVGISYFTASLDAVLPWLERQDAATLRFLDNEWACFTCTEQEFFPEWENSIGCEGRSTQAARAAVICLLRAHGVEVEFTR